MAQNPGSHLGIQKRQDLMDTMFTRRNGENYPKGKE
jgi:hypothetical protein